MGETIDTAKVKDIGIEAYIYRYPLVTLDMVRKQETNTAKPDGECAPNGAGYQDAVLSARGKPLAARPQRMASRARVKRVRRLTLVAVRALLADRPFRCPLRNPYLRSVERSKRSRFITLFQAATKSYTNFSLPSSLP